MSIDIGGDASGAIAAIAECQAAIDGLEGKTVKVDFPRLPGETDEQLSARFKDFLRECRGGDEGGDTP